MTVFRDMSGWFSEVQGELCRMFQRLDSVSMFSSDRWERTGGGGGLTRILEGDGPLERVAVNFSAVWGRAPASMTAGEAFAATGISVICHPRSPHAPSFHANLRYLENGPESWFGGGADLTPYYLDREDASAFHRQLADICGRHRVADYPSWKRACDEYFWLHHRDEARGIGGIFFDRLSGDGVAALVEDLGGSLGSVYLSILEPKIDAPFSAEERAWQLRRRGRYAEFNLIWDRGTRFGLETGGRAESILASLPPRAMWMQDRTPAPGTPEAELLEVLREPVDWL